MKNHALCIIMFIYMLVFAFGAYAATVVIDPATQESPAVGEMLTVGVNIQEAIDLFSCSFNLTFDSAALKFSTIEQGDFPGSDGASAVTLIGNQIVDGQGVLAEMMALTNSEGLTPELIDEVNSAGGITVAIDRLGGAGIDGSGSLATITFEVLEVKSSTLALQNAHYSTPEQVVAGEENPADTEDGSIFVGVIVTLPPVVREHADGDPMLALEAIYDEADVHGHTYIDVWEGAMPEPIDAGSFLEFQIVMYSGNPTFRGTVDLHTTDGTTLRDSGATDQNGLSAHPGTDLSEYAKDGWYHRKISLAPLAGKTIDGVMIATDSNEHSAGIFRIYADNIQITDGEGILEAIWMGEPIIPATGTSSATGTTFAGTTGMSDYAVTIVSDTLVMPRGKIAFTWGGMKSGR